MPTQFTFSGRIVSIIDERRLCVRVDKEHVEKISTMISSYSDKTIIKDTLIVNVKESRFAIGIDWQELKDLVGVHVKISATLRRYSYWRNRESFDDENDRHLTTIKYKGVSVIAGRISTIQ